MRPKPEVVPPPPAHPEAIVFCADGAGDFRYSSKYLREAISDEKLPIEVRTFAWSHGYGKVVSDQVDYRHARAQGKRLSEEVWKYHQEHPDTEIHLWGHSAGSMVVLAGLEDLPPGIVKRVVLLSPSVSTRYDLRPALASVSEQMHVFYSHQDVLYLAIMVRIFGTADRRWGPPSGRLGFDVPKDGGAEPELYSKLQQHAWHRDNAAQGHDGGHYGAYQPDYLRAHVLPWLRP